jgi:hypothetical protein
LSEVVAQREVGEVGREMVHGAIKKIPQNKM